MCDGGGMAAEPPQCPLRLYQIHIRLRHGLRLLE